MAAIETVDLQQPVKGGYRDHPWYHPKRLTLDLFGVALAAVASQIVVPGIVPTLQLKLYQYTGIDFAEPEFIAVGSHQDLAGDPKQAKIEFNRIFCGFTLTTAKSCLMHRVLPAEGVAPYKWTFDKSPIKEVLLGARSPTAFVAWISQKSGTGGSAVAPDYGDGMYVGYGIACTKNAQDDEGRPYPIKVLYGNLPKEFDPTVVTPLADIPGAVATLMTKTKLSVELKDGQPTACTQGPTPPDLKQELKPDPKLGAKQARR
ncbi:hypothetical protein [Bradyrhizobium sp. S3.5.5]|uniref:hypothetical protein n=1 Tax=Bradyrhizobium sp. S3.5.5 TaxID=3156430 RepID=UPI0033912014